MDLSGNQLCGVYVDDNFRRQGTYTAEGITAIANALKVTASLTECKLRKNRLRVEGWTQTEVELSLKGLGPQDAKLLAPEISVKNENSFR